MKPVFFDFELPLLGQVTFPAYLTMLLLGFLAAVLVARREAERAGLEGKHIVDLGLVCLVAAVLGARLLSVLTDGHLEDFIRLCTDPSLVDAPHTAVRFCQSDAQCGGDYLCNTEVRDAVVDGARQTMCYPPGDCLAVFKFWQGGLTFYGGLLLAVPLGSWFARRRGLPLGKTLDLATPALFLGLALGRLGCFFNGCCYGAETSSIFGVRFPGLAAERHPTQLYESTLALGLFAVLHFVLRKRSRGDGELFGWGLALYGTARSALEILRDDPRGALGPLSTSQVISIPLVIAGVVLVVRARRSR